MPLKIAITIPFCQLLLTDAMEVIVAQLKLLVGIVGSREASKLSRTDKDWYRLLEVCQTFGTLIADELQIYDSNYLDDQLVLGIKETLSVMELKVIRQRMQAGQESKARRGELFKRLAVGYVLDPVGEVALHPDQRICEAIRLVFVKFRERWSERQLFPPKKKD